MLDGISDIARGVQTSNPGGLAFRQMMEELRATCSPKRQHELLEQSSDQAVSRQNVRRAVKLMRKASAASQQRKWERAFAMARLALEAVGRDKQLLRELLNTNQLTLQIIPRRPIARDRHNLVDPRLTPIDQQQARCSFACRYP